MRARHRLVAAVLLGTLPLAACTAGAASRRDTAAPNTTTAAAASGTGAATRWWSNAAAAQGSRIDPAAPVAAGLHASRTDYCTMLRDTLRAGHSILPGAGATDPALLAATRAFVGELTAVAPAPVSTAWHTVGSLVLTLVTRAGAGTRVPLQHVDTAAVAQAARAIAADARTGCGVDVSVASR